MSELNYMTDYEWAKQQRVELREYIPTVMYRIMSIVESGEKDSDRLAACRLVMSKVLPDLKADLPTSEDTTSEDLISVFKTIAENLPK